MWTILQLVGAVTLVVGLGLAWLPLGIIAAGLIIGAVGVIGEP